MKANEIQVGRKYRAKVGGNLTTVRVDAIREVSRGRRNNYSGRYEYSNKVVYDVTNLTTGRRTTFQSAAKFRCTVRDMAADHYLERITGDAEVKPAFSVAEVNARQGREMEAVIGPIPEDKRLVIPTPESEAFEAMFDETETVECSCGFDKAIDGKCLRCGQKIADQDSELPTFDDLSMTTMPNGNLQCVACGYVLGNNAVDNCPACGVELN